MARPVVYIHRVEWCPAEYYLTDANRRLLASFAEVRDFGAHPRPVTHAEMVDNLRGANGVLLLNGSHPEEITGKAMRESGTTVRVIAVSHWWPPIEAMARDLEGSGVEILDRSDACNQSVAEWTLGALINGLRKTDVFDRLIKTKPGWPRWRGVAGQLNGATVGLVALGRVGRWVARYLKPFDVRVLVYDPAVSAAQAVELGIEKTDLDTLLRESDAVSLHAPVLPSTKGMIGRRELALMRDGALLVNSARAWLLDGAALLDELRSGRLRAYLDVFEPEPLPDNDPLRKLDGAVLTPHVAGTTDLMFERCGRFAIEALRERLS